MLWEKARCGKAEELELEAVLGFETEAGCALPERVAGGPGGCVGAPAKLVVLQDESGAGEMAGGADDFGAGPVVGCHDALAVEDVLDGVLGLSFFDDVFGRYSLCDGERGHDVGFDELIVRRAAGEDDAGSYASFKLADAFEGAFALLGRWGAVSVGWSAEDDDGVEVGESGVVSWDRPIDDDGSNYRNQKEGEREGHDPAQRFHLRLQANCFE